ncbi:MAG TPA: hypothetical protein VLF09_03220 [Cellvibrio sp.]|nr:hypothetical protein [Cellvibrio sp.]
MKKYILFLFAWLLPKQSVAAATRDSILGASDRIAGFVDIPEWGGRVYIGTLTVAQRAKFLDAIGRLGGGGDPVEQGLKYFRSQVELISSGVVGADSEALFTDQDVERLATKSPAIVGRVYDQIVRLNGFSVVATEEAAKN